jgi:protein SCO1/2
VQFVRNFDDPRIVGLTGSPAAIAAVAKQYAVYFKKEPPGAGGGYLVGHQRRLPI